MEVEAPAHVHGAHRPLHRAGRRRPARPHARRADHRDPRVGHRAAHRAARDPPTDAAAKPDIIFGGVGLGLGGAAAQPPARRVDARAGRTPRGRPARRPRLTGRPAHRRLPAREPGDGARQAAGRPGRHDAGARGGGQRAGWRSASADAGSGAGCPPCPSDPTVLLRLSREDFVVLAGGGGREHGVGRDRGRRRARPAPRRAGGHPVTVTPSSWSARRHPCPGRAHRRGHRGDRGRDRATTPRWSWPGRGARVVLAGRTPTSWPGREGDPRGGARSLARAARGRPRVAGLGPRARRLEAA